MSDTKSYYAQQIWTVSLTVTAFAIAQTIAFAFKLGDKDFALEVQDGWRLVIFAVFISTCVYIAAIWVLDRIQIGLIDPSETAVIRAIEQVQNLKLIAIVICGVLACALALEAHSHPVFTS